MVLDSKISIISYFTVSTFGDNIHTFASNWYLDLTKDQHYSYMSPILRT